MCGYARAVHDAAVIMRYHAIQLDPVGGER